MKHLILLLLVLALLLMAIENAQTTIQVVIVIPSDLVPYYEWLLSFPGWQPPQDEPPDKQPTHVIDL